MNIITHIELNRLMHRNLGKPYAYFVPEGKTYRDTVNLFGAYASKNGLLMKSKKLLVLEDENTKPMLAVRVWFYRAEGVKQ